MLAIDESNISWDQDRRHKYALIPPQNFQTVPALRGGASINTTLDRDEHFIVWMRPAALPNFRKLWGRINQDIPQGTILSVAIDNRCSFGLSQLYAAVLGLVTCSLLQISAECVALHRSHWCSNMQGHDLQHFELNKPSTDLYMQ